MADSDKCPFCNERHKLNHVGGEIPSKMSCARNSKGISEPCRSPLCGSPVYPSSRRIRLYCSYRCRQIHSILGRAARMLLPLGPARTLEILHSLESRGSEDKAGVEIVNPRAI